MISVRLHHKLNINKSRAYKIYRNDWYVSIYSTREFIRFVRPCD